MRKKMTLKLINARIVTDEEVIDGGTLFAKDGIIEYVGEENGAEADLVYDLSGDYLLAGFVDIHSHGGGGYDFMDASCEQMLKIADFHLSHGTTTLVATTLTDEWKYIEAALEKYAALPENKLSLSGVHMEGPWFSPLQCGAQNTDTMDTPSVEKLEALLRKYPFIKRISLAPEIDRDFKVGSYASAHGIVAAIGHTDADFDTVMKAEERGYSLVTHLYSGMKGVTRVNAYRVAGAVEGCLYNDGLTVEVIADGKHLPEGLLKLIYKCKGADRICLVTDSMRGAGGAEGERILLGRVEQGNVAEIEDGVAKLPDRTAFAGSVATTDRLFRTMLALCGATVVDVSKMISKTPARVMGYTDRGIIKAGMLADLVVADGEFNVKSVFLRGNKVK